jgi:hypothetical protein
MIVTNKKFAVILNYVGIALLIIAGLLAYFTEAYKLYIFILCPGAIFMIPDYYLFYKEKRERNEQIAIIWAVQFVGLVAMSIMLLIYSLYSLVE